MSDLPASGTVIMLHILIRPAHLTLMSQHVSSVQATRVAGRIA